MLRALKAFAHVYLCAEKRITNFETEKKKNNVAISRIIRPNTHENYNKKISK